MATRLVKPVGEYIVEPGEEEAFLQPLPLRLLPGIERDDLARLGELHLTRVGEVARLTLAQLAVAAGNCAPHLYTIVRGIDPSPVLPVHQPPAVTADSEFPAGGNDQVMGALYRCVEQVGFALRQQRLAARRVTVVLDYADGVRVTKQETLAAATAHA